MNSPSIVNGYGFEFLTHYWIKKIKNNLFQKPLLLQTYEALCQSFKALYNRNLRLSIKLPI